MLIDPNVQNPTTIALTSSQLFTLTVTDIVSGCTGSDQVLITITGGPLSVDATATPDTSCTGDSIQLMAIVSGGSGNYTYSWSSNPSGFSSTIANPVVYPTITTTYTVVVNDGFNTISDWVIVTVNHLPEIPAIPVGPDTIDLYYTTTSDYSTSPVANADYYIWVLEPSNMGTIAGNGTSVIITWSGVLGQANLSVKAVNPCGQSDLSQPLSIYVDNTVGMEDMEKNKITIYPNPNNGRFTISSSYVGISEVYLYNLYGRAVMNFSVSLFNEKIVTMDCSNLSKGIYFVKVLIGKESRIRKVVVK